MLSGDAIIPTTPNLARFGGTAQGVTAAKFQGWAGGSRFSSHAFALVFHLIGLPPKLPGLRFVAQPVIRTAFHLALPGDPAYGPRQPRELE